jgi:hypothetical protein
MAAPADRPKIARTDLFARLFQQPVSACIQPKRSLIGFERLRANEHGELGHFPCAVFMLWSPRGGTVRTGDRVVRN